MIRVVLILSLFYFGMAFQMPMPMKLTTSNHGMMSRPLPSSSCLFAKKDVSRSGTKRDRLDRLAELEDERVTTDSSLVLKGGAAFLGIIVLGVIVAFSSGVLEPY